MEGVKMGTLTGSKSLIYVFVNWWCKSLIFQNKAILTNRIRSLNYQNQRYRDFINLEFVVNSFPLNSIVNTRSCYLMTCEWYSCFLTITIQERTFFANYRSFHLALVFFFDRRISFMSSFLDYDGLALTSYQEDLIYWTRRIL